MKIIGRSEQYATLMKIYGSKKPEFVVVKGRRRVGKTYLVNNTFENEFCFKFTALSPVDAVEGGRSKLNLQLEAFYLSLRSFGHRCRKPKNWLQAFDQLKVLISSKGTEQRQVVFIDELPWLDTPRSDFVSSFEHFWNDWGSTRENLMLIVCGSSNSWINDNLLNNYGGLYNRVTKIIDLYPFDLKETKDFFDYSGVVMSDYDVIQSYMIFGGIPFYLNQLDGNMSLAQNVDKLFFSPNAVLRNEFDLLFRSAFKNPDDIKKIVVCLSKKRSGLTKKELTELTGISDGGSLTTLLKSLTAGNIVEKYVPFGGKRNEHLYKLIDRLCLFYLYFVNNNQTLDKTFWQDNVLSRSVSSWRGFAFEQICFLHIEKIKNALKIGGLSTQISAFSYEADGEERGGQVDLVIVRADNIVDVCEIKFYGAKYDVTQSDVEKSKSREAAILKKLPKKYAVHHVLITTFGACKNKFSSYYQAVITIDDLLK